MAAITVKLHYARLVFGPKRRRGAYELHRDLCHAFDSERDGAYLFRADVDRRARPARVVALVQSPGPADWARIGDKLDDCQTREHEWRLTAGAAYRFFLRANATRAKKAEHSDFAEADPGTFRAARGKRVPIRGEPALTDWLVRQGQGHGFEVAETPFAQDDRPPLGVRALRITEGRDVDWRVDGRHGHHAGTDFEGLLRVTDANALASALRTGIGPGKAFGFGMLSLARV
jgi:CRISPR system Cascade subunit CasE